MTRPEGFDPATRRQAAPPPPAKKATQRSAATKPVVAVKVQPATSVLTVTAPGARTEPRIGRPDREARIELRRAARERRRYERLEVRRFTRRQRNRRIGWATAGGIVVLLGIMLLVAIFSPLLSLQTVTVRGTSRVDTSEVTAAVNDQMGKPLALIDFGEITKKLGAVALIRSYSTEIVPPSTLVIRVTEREPVGVIANGTQWNLVDPAGVVVQSVASVPKNLPVIDAGKAGGAPFTAAAEVLLGMPADLLARIGSISATTEDDVTFTFDDTKQRVIWGNSDREAQKASALKALITSQKKDKTVDFNVSSPDIALVIDHTDAPVTPTSTGTPAP